MIDEYKFGSITINGVTYKHDIEVHWTGDIYAWWRAEGHSVDIGDIERAVESNPEIIIIGTGAQEQLDVPNDIIEALRLRRIQLVIDPTEEATKTFNVINEESEEEDGRQRRVVGLFHLTC